MQIKSRPVKRAPDARLLMSDSCSRLAYKLYTLHIVACTILVVPFIIASGAVNAHASTPRSHFFAYSSFAVELGAQARVDPLHCLRALCMFKIDFCRAALEFACYRVTHASCLAADPTSAFLSWMGDNQKDKKQDGEPPFGIFLRITIWGLGPEASWGGG